MPDSAPLVEMRRSDARRYGFVAVRNDP